MARRRPIAVSPAALDAIAWAVAQHAKAHAPAFQPPGHKGGCGRDPAMGPGTCVAWWEGCKSPEKRGCFRLWAASDAVVGWWRERLPEAWTAHPPELAPLTAKRLMDLGEAEVRELEGEPWQWRRKAAQPAQEAA